jgi:F0F1-type ATP synthase assembly protein I
VKPGDMAQIEQEISEAEEIAWRKLRAMGAFILASNMISTAIGVFFGYLIWGV